MVLADACGLVHMQCFESCGGPVCCDLVCDSPVSVVDDSRAAWDYSAWVRTYALFLEERLECFRVLKYDVESERPTVSSWSDALERQQFLDVVGEARRSVSVGSLELMAGASLGASLEWATNRSLLFAMSGGSREPGCWSWWRQSFSSAF